MSLKLYHVSELPLGYQQSTTEAPIAEDSLVATGWNSGEGRTKPGITQAEAGRKMREWVEKGAAVP